MRKLSKYEIADMLRHKPLIQAKALNNSYFRQGFQIGLEYQQARIDRLLAYVKGQVPMSEIEKELESAADDERQ